MIISRCRKTKKLNYNSVVILVYKLGFKFLGESKQKIKKYGENAEY